MSAVRTVSVALKMQVQDFVAGGGKAVATTKALGGELDTLAKTHKDKMADLTKVTLGIGGALAAVAGAAVAASYAFDKEMSEVQAVSGATAGQLETLRNAAIQAGKDTTFSASEAATAEAELAKAGISTADILGGALSGSLSLAAAGSLDLGDAATISAQAMNIFGLQGSAVGHIADLLASGANASATDVKSLGDSLNQAGLVAHGATMSLEDTVGTLAALAQNGLVGSDAGTSLKTMLQALQAPSGTTAKLMDKLGISAYDASGKFIGITNVAQMLQDKLSGLTQEQRDNALATIFGSDAVRAATVLYTQGASGIQGWIDKTNQSGAAAATAKTKMNNLAGDVEALKGSFETLAIESGGSVTNALRSVTGAATSTVNAFVDLPHWLQSTAVWMSGVSGAALLGGTGLVKLRGTVNTFKSTLEDMGPAGSKASKAVGAISKWGGIATVAAVAGFGLYEVFDHIANSSKPVAMNIDDATDSLAQFAATGQASGDMAKAFGGDLSGVASKVTQLKDAQDALAKSQANIKSNPYAGRLGIVRANSDQADLQHQIDVINQAFTDTDKSLTQLVSGGQTQAATADFQFFAKQMLNAGMSMDQINAKFPDYTKAAGNAALQTHATAQGFGSATENLGLMDMSLNDAIKAIGSLSDVEKSLNGANISMMSANDDMQASFDAVTAAIKTNGKTAKDHKTELDDSTAAGRANREALLGLVDATNKAAQATLDQTGSTSKANDVLAAGRAELIKDAEKMGLSAKAAAKLADQLLSIPPVNAPVTVTGLDGALAGVRKLSESITKLHGKTVNVEVHYSNGMTASANRWGGAYEHAAVGTLRDASMYGATSPGRYMIAEPQTGGEAFVPKRGNYGRSMGILGQAASWYGASVVPGGGGGGGPIQVVVQPFTGPFAGLSVLQDIQYQVSIRSGDPVKELTPKGSR